MEDGGRSGIHRGGAAFVADVCRAFRSARGSLAYWLADCGQSVVTLLHFSLDRWVSSMLGTTVERRFGGPAVFPADLSWRGDRAGLHSSIRSIAGRDRGNAGSACKHDLGLYGLRTVTGCSDAGLRRWIAGRTDGRRLSGFSSRMVLPARGKAHDRESSLDSDDRPRGIRADLRVVVVRAPFLHRLRRSDGVATDNICRVPGRKEPFYFGHTSYQRVRVRELKLDDGSDSQNRAAYCGGRIISSDPDNLVLGD